jgi:prephenate dehydratase
VQSGKADLGMIPIENSIAGRVADIQHLLPHAKLHIVGEYFLPIHFNLMGAEGRDAEEHQDRGEPLHALGQCRRFIRKHSYKPVIAADTAVRRAIFPRTSNITRAAHAPKLAAKIYGLEGARRERRGRGP